MPLFKLETGVATSSAGLVCAEMAGVKQAVVERAREIVNATQARRRVEPLYEILRDALLLTDDDKENIKTLLAMDWPNASDDEIAQFLARGSRSS